MLYMFDVFRYHKIYDNNTVRPLLSAVLGRTKTADKRGPRIIEV